MAMSFIFYIAVVGFISNIAEIGFFVWLHVTPSPYHPIKHAVSDYGVGNTKKLFSFYLWLNNISSVTTAAVLFFAVPYIPPLFSLFLLVLIVGRIGLLLFPTDLEGGKPTVRGRLHYVFAIILFGLLYVFIVHISTIVAMEPVWSSIRGVLNVFSILTTISLIAVIISMVTPLRKIFGFIERSFIVATSIWFLIFSAFLVVLLR